MVRQGRGAGIRALKAVKCGLFSLCLLLAGCGTNTSKLLREDSRLYWQADYVLQIAEPLDLALEDAAYEAEAALNRACRVIYKDLIARAFSAHDASFFEQFWSSLEQVFVALVPVEPVENCATAQRAYKTAIEALCRKLQDMLLAVECPG
jgi:hypothetical protein